MSFRLSGCRNLSPHISLSTALLLLSVYSLLLTVNIAYAQETILKAGEEPISISATTVSFDPDTNLYIAEGNVEITQGNRVLSADRATLNKDTKEAKAEGRVVLMEDGDIVSCNSLEINMADKTGIIRDGKLFMKKGNLHVSGEEIKKTGEDDYTIKNGRFTTCDGEPPSWSFSASTASVTLGEYLTSWNTAFRIKDVPTMYMPFILMPVKKERQSGFLIPRVSYSDEDGFELDNSYFWAISKNTDATISLNYLSMKGLEEGLEYRYVLSKTTKGTFYGTYLNEWRGEERWTLKYNHEQYFSPTFYNKTNINYVSDDEYYSTYGDTVEERSQDTLESYVSFTLNRPGMSLVTQFKYYEDLGDDQDTTLQKLPEILFTGFRQPLGNSQIYLTTNASAIYFYMKEGESGERMDLYPRFSMTINPSGYFTFTPELGLRETAYWIDAQDAWKSREMYDIKGTLSTTFLKTFETGGTKLRKIRHSIEPEFVYEYIPDVDQDELPSFDPEDRIEKKNLVTYSLTNRLAGKIYSSEEDYEVTELLLFKISEGYDINEAVRSLDSSDDERRPFTDVTLELRVTPDTKLSLISDASINVYENYLSSFNTSLNVNNTRGDSLTAEYRFTKDSNDYVRGVVSVKASDSVNFSYDTRYSFFDDNYLENIYALDYHPQCWSVQLSYSERPEEKKYYVTFNLSGMGTVAKFKNTTQY